MTELKSTCIDVIDRHWANPEMMGLGVLLSGRVTKEGLDIPHVFTFVAAKDHKLVHDPEASHWEGEGPLLMRVTLEDLLHNRHEVPELDPALNGWLTDLLTAFPTHWHGRLIQLATEGKLDGCTVLTRTKDGPLEISGKDTAAAFVRTPKIKRVDYKLDHVVCWIPSLLVALRQWVELEGNTQTPAPSEPDTSLRDGAWFGKQTNGGVDADKLRRAAHDGRIQSQKVGGRRRYAPKDVAALYPEYASHLLKREQT